MLPRVCLSLWLGRLQERQRAASISGGPGGRGLGSLISPPGHMLWELSSLEASAPVWKVWTTSP